MDEALLKSGVWPNIAVPAGTDPRAVMREHGVNDMALRVAVHDMGERERALEGLVRDMYADKVNEATCLDFSGRRFLMGRDIETINGYRERMRALGIEVD